MACALSKDSDQPGHPPSLISLRVCMKKALVLSYPLSAQRRFWSAQADMSLRCAHSHFVGFVMRWLICKNFWTFIFFSKQKRGFIKHNILLQEIMFLLNVILMQSNVLLLLENGRHSEPGLVARSVGRMHVCLACGQLRDWSWGPAIFFRGDWSWNHF